MNRTLENLKDQVKDFVDWVDSVPSVPAAVGGVLVGMLVPTAVWVVLVVVAVAYSVVKFTR